MHKTITSVTTVCTMTRISSIMLHVVIIWCQPLKVYREMGYRYPLFGSQQNQLAKVADDVCFPSLPVDYYKCYARKSNSSTLFSLIRRKALLGCTRSLYLSTFLSCCASKCKRVTLFVLNRGK